MPTVGNPWSRIAAAPDAEVKAYKGLRSQIVAQLEHEGVDTTAYAASKRAFVGRSTDNTAETLKRIEQNYLRDKRALLQALAGLATKKVTKGLAAAQARNVEATQLNDEVDAKLQTALGGLEGVITAIRSAGNANYQQAQMLNRQHDELEACDTALCEGAADEAEDAELAAALAAPMFSPALMVRLSPLRLP